jgi:hypothetical protein
MTSTKCPTCGHDLIIPVQLAGSSVKCTECGELVRVAEPVAQKAEAKSKPKPSQPLDPWPEEKERLERRLLRDAAFNHRVIRNVLLWLITLMIVSAIGIILLVVITLMPRLHA